MSNHSSFAAPLEVEGTSQAECSVPGSDHPPDSHSQGARWSDGPRSPVYVMDPLSASLITVLTLSSLLDRNDQFRCLDILVGDRYILAGDSIVVWVLLWDT